MRESRPDGDGRPKVSAADQIRIWLNIATQSVGGGSATLYLMRRNLVRKRHLLTDAEFLQDWTLSRLSPGVTSIAFTTLIGRRLGGRPGVVYAIGAMLVPASVITVLLIALLVEVESDPAIGAALAGMGPVTIGMMLGMTTAMARSAIRDGRARIADLTMVLIAVIVGFVAPISPIVVILGGGVIGTLFLGRREKSPESDALPEAGDD